MADAAPDADAGAPATADPVDSGPLFADCTRAVCAAGLQCFPDHTSLEWLPVDLFGHCYVTCGGGPSAGGVDPIDRCDRLGGRCACPQLADGGGWRCAPNDVAPVALVCVPVELLLARDQ